MKKRRFINKDMGRGLEIEDYVLTATEKEAAKLERPLQKKGLDIFWWGIVFCLMVLSGRVFYLTGIKGAYYQGIAKGNSVRSITIKAPRGRIFDKNGIALVNNVPSIDAVFVPADVAKDVSNKKEFAKKISDVLQINEGEILMRLESADAKSLNPVLLKEGISQDETLILLEKATELPGVRIDKTAVREYVDGPIFSHLLGYEGKIEKKEYEKNPGYSLTDYIGKQGIEKSFEKYLRGVPGATQMEVDSLGNVKREVGLINPKPGSDLYLSIDAGLQKKLYDSMVATSEKTGTKTGAAVAIDPRNGKVLAFISTPSFDNNLFAKKISQEQYLNLINDQDKPLFNRALAGEYPPGSTVKPGIAAGALMENVITPDTVIDGLGGFLRIGSFSFGDWKVHGPSDVRQAIAESNDIFFYTVGGGYGNIQGLGMNRMKKYYNMFGFGKPTGIDLGGEASGFIPDEQWKQDKFNERWFVGNSYHASIGQGYVTATPLQLANYTAAIANGGSLFVPQLVEKIKKNNGEIEKIEPQITANIELPKDIFQIIKEGMRQTITSGTAQQLNNLPVEVAGKTGTAQFGNEDKTHAWFISFAPYENPEIAMVVLAEGAGEGHSSAVPITRDVYQWYFGGRN